MSFKKLRQRPSSVPVKAPRSSALGVVVAKQKNDPDGYTDGDDNSEYSTYASPVTQDKFQVTPAFNPNEKRVEEEGWTTFEANRVVKDVRRQESGADNRSYTRPGMMDKFPKYKRGYMSQTEPLLNSMPPGMDINNQEDRDIRDMPFSMSGRTDVTNASSQMAFEKGYTRREMMSTDDQYTGERQDLFYGSVADEDGNEGFLERNNYLDRL